MKKDRFGIIIFFFLFFFVLLEIRLFNITIFPDKRLKTVTDTTHFSRGTIYDAQGRELAVTTEFYSLYARPPILSAQMKTAVKDYLMKYVGFQISDLAILESSNNFVWIRRKMPRSDMEIVKSMLDSLKKDGNLKKDEFGILPEDGRYYRYAAASAVVGAVGIDNQGLSGLENSLNSYLIKGDSVYTTLDGELCSVLADELKKGVELNQAESASAALLSVKDRKILAMASVPSFEPNNTRTFNTASMKNRVTSGIYEPGSVMKQFSAAFALEKGLAAPNSPVYNCSGSAEIDKQIFTCETAHGKVDLSRIIQKSCNVGMVQIANQFNRGEFEQFLRDLGFGKPVPIPLGDNESGILRPLSKWSGISKHMIAIGQEIGVTTAQLMQASGIVAGGGIYKTPLLIDRISSPEGKEEYHPVIDEFRVLSQDTTKKLLAMMQTVVSENGTAISARIEGITIAGKTGTGQVAKENGSGYYSDLYNAVFLGYIPAENPQYTLVVVINKPRGDIHTGGAVAAPVFADIIRRMIVSTSYITNP